MAQSCPISRRRVDVNMVRIISFQVALFTVAILVTQESFLASILFFDFMMRAWRKMHLSPFHLIGELVIKGWGIAPKLCDESPKRFALFLGLIISSFIMIFYLAELTIFATSISIILLICALLETLFDFCIGCKLYYLIQLTKGLFNNDRNIQ